MSFAKITTPIAISTINNQITKGQRKFQEHRNTL